MTLALLRRRVPGEARIPVPKSMYFSEASAEHSASGSNSQCQAARRIPGQTVGFPVIPPPAFLFYFGPFVRFMKSLEEDRSQPHDHAASNQQKRPCPEYLAWLGFFAISFESIKVCLYLDVPQGDALVMDDLANFYCLNPLCPEHGRRGAQSRRPHSLRGEQAMLPPEIPRLRDAVLRA